MLRQSTVLWLGAMLLMVLPLRGEVATPPVDRVPGMGSTGLGADTDLSEDDPFAPPSEGDSDLGEQFILQRSPQRTPIRVAYFSDAWWSDNLGATNMDEEQGWFWSNYLQAAWRPRLADNLFLDAFVEQNIYLYDDADLDFESTQLGLGVIRIFPGLDDLAVFARYEYLFTHADNPAYDLLINSHRHLSDHFHRFRIGAHKNLFVRPLDSAYMAADAAFAIDTDPSSLERNEYSLQLGYQRKLAYRFDAALFYRGAWLDYDSDGREDWNHTIGFELSYLLRDWATLHSTVFYANNDSNTPGGSDDYESLQAGLGVGLTTKF